jgi:hypothetical protein
MDDLERCVVQHEFASPEGSVCRIDRMDEVDQVIKNHCRCLAGGASLASGGGGDDAVGLAGAGAGGEALVLDAADAVAHALVDHGDDVDKDIYVFGYMAKEDRKNQRAEVMLVGYATKSEVTKEENVKKGRVGNGHYNYEVPYRNLSSIVMLSK